eukprot:RCo039654
MQDAASRGALCQAKADVNLQDSTDSTPLHYAADAGDLKSVSVLLTAGADPKVLDAENRNPAHRAAEAKKWSVVSAILKWHAPGSELPVLDLSVASSMACGKCTILHLVAKHPDVPLDLVQALVQAKAPIGIKDGSSKVPFEVAFAAHCDNAASVLVGPSVAAMVLAPNVTVEPRTGGNALHVCAQYNMHLTAAALVQAGADVTAEDGSCNVPFNVALTAHSDESGAVLVGPSVAAEVLDPNATVELSTGRNSLHLCAQYKMHRTVAALVLAGAKVGAKDSWGRIAFAVAV